MPTLIENQKLNSSKFNSKFNNQAEPKVLTKYDTKPFQKDAPQSILDSSFKSDYSDSATDDELRLNKCEDDEIQEQKNERFEPKKYDGFQLKILPTKDKILIRNNYTYLDPNAFSIVWINVILFIILHSLGFYGVYRCFSEKKYYAFVSSNVFY